MIFTVTERSLYKRCRRRWDYSSKNRQGIQPIIDAPALTLGLVMHKALEQWFLHPDLSLPDIFKANAMLALDGIRQSYKEAVGVDISPVELADVKQSIVMGVYMAVNYEAYYVSPVPEGYKLISPEQRIIINLPGTPHQLEGRVDALIQSDANGAYFIMDHKTYGKRPNFTDLANNDQFLAYVYIARKALGQPVQGYMYNGLWKRDKPGKNHTIGDLFHRQVFERPEYELEQFEIQLAAELNEMGSDPFIYPNHRWEGCWDCKSFTELCEAQSKNPISFDLMKKHSYRKRDWDEELEWLLDSAE